MKKVGSILLIIVLLLFVGGCFKEKENVVTDAAKFKEEYESLNGKTTDAGISYREINISEDNPFVYATASEIVEKIDNGEDFAVYFGFKSCPWCRSMLETLIKVAKDLKIGRIYYVDVLELRDTYELKDGKPVKTKDGGEGYSELLDRLDSVLSDYTLTNAKGKSVSTGEKRIYAPNIVSVIDGKPEKLTTGISEDQNDSYMELTDKMKQDMYDNIECVLSCLEKSVCTEGC